MTARDAVRAIVLLWAATVAVVLVTAVLPGRASATRGAFGFQLDAAPPGTWTDASSYFTANLRVIAALLLAAWARPRSGPLRRPLDVLVATMAVVNTSFVGAAVGAYGFDLIPRLAHLPLEWAAVGVGLAAYGWRGGTVSCATLLRVGLVATVLLAVAAVTEAFCPS